MSEIKQIFEVFQKIKIAAGSNKKAELVALLKNNKTFNKICHLIYNPEISFGLKLQTISRPEKCGFIDDDNIFEAFEALSARQLSGNAAKQILGQVYANANEEQQLVIELLLNQKLGSGVSTSKILDLFPEINTYMVNIPLCSKPDEKIIKKFPWKDAVGQIKSDGLRIIVENNNGAISVKTRNGNPINLSFMEESFKTFPGYVLDGELLVTGTDRKTGNGIINSIQQGVKDIDTSGVYIKAWDLIPLDEYKAEVGNSTYIERYDELVTKCSNLDRIAICECYYISTYDEAIELFQKMLAIGEEGIIVKNSKAKYKGKRTHDQLKFKDVQTCDLRIVDIVAGNPGGKYERICGAILCQDDNGIVSVSVGTGLSDELRNELWNNKESYIGRIIEVEYNEMIKSKGKEKASLFLPAFKQFRIDKDTTSLN